MTARTVDIRGISLAYDDIGEGDDVILFVHGHPFDRSMWAPQHSAFVTGQWRMIASDLRGYGRSSVVPGKTGLDVFAGDIVALADHLNVHRFVVCGLSMGGQIAMEICRLYPARVRGLVLAATFPRAETDSGRIARNDMADRLLREGMEEYGREALSKMLAPRTIAAMPGVAAKVLSMMLAAHPEGAAAALRGRAERPDYAETLASVEVPALVVVGDQDAFTTQEDAEQMTRLLKHSRLVWMPGVGHMPNLERADQFNAELVEFLAAIAASRSHQVSGGWPPASA